MDALSETLATDPRIAFALLFGSAARGGTHAGSDLDIAIGLAPGQRFEARDIGALVSRLEEASGRDVDLVLLDEAPPALAYRVFRDGVTLLQRDRPRLVAAKTRAILEYLDFKPVEELFVDGALRAAARGR